MVQTQRIRTKERSQAAGPLSLERDARQLLADKIPGNQAGISAAVCWLSIPTGCRATPNARCAAIGSAARKSPRKWARPSPAGLRYRPTRLFYPGIRFSRDAILVTYYNAPNAEVLRAHYENLPEKLRQQGIEPRIPWLYDFHLEFRFK